jgi:hypothetical protein
VHQLGCFIFHIPVESALHSAAQAAARNQDLLSRRRSPIGRARPCRHGEDGAASRYSPRSGWWKKLNMLLRNYLRQMSSEPAIFYRESYKNTNRHQTNISCTTKNMWLRSLTSSCKCWSLWGCSPNNIVSDLETEAILSKPKLITFDDVLP